MLRYIATASAALLLALVPASPAGADRRAIHESFPVRPEQRIRLDFPVGALRILAVEGSEVRVDLELHCRDRKGCDEALAEMRVESRSRERELFLEVTGYPRWNKDDLEVEGTIEVPGDRELVVDMGVGELEVEGVAGDVELDVGVGAVKVIAPREAVRSVSLDTGIGDASLHGPDQNVEGRRALLVGSEVDWDEGEGDAHIRVDLGVGEVSVWLE